jgi:hypothetical protein
LNNNVTAEEVSRARTALQAAGIEPSEATRGQIREVCGVGDRRARTIREWIRRGGLETTGETSETHERKGDTWTISLPKTRIQSLEELVKQCDIDLTEWEVERWICNKWEVGAKDAAKVLRVEPLFQVKAWLRRKTNVVAIKNEIAELKKEAKAAARQYPLIARPQSKSGYLLELSIPDLHVGKLAWAKETGWEDYDSDIAVAVFEDALTKLLERTSSYSFDRILFTIGNDLFHTDSKQPMTTAGTPQDVDGRYQRTFVKTRQMITRALERTRLIAPVDAVLVPGNHDTLSTWHLGDSLECLFAKCADINVNNDPTMRKYYEWGRVMLLLTHGNKGKLQDYPLVMATEQPEMFGRTVHREAHTGDKHQLKVHELHGVRVRISPALCPPDAWHADSMYVGNPRSAEAFVWHAEEGLVGQAIYTVPSKRK